MSDITTRATTEAVARLEGAVQERLHQMSRVRLRELIGRAIAGKFRMCVPPEPDDDDLILSALIDEVFALRDVVAIVDEYAAARLAIETLPPRPYTHVSAPVHQAWIANRAAIEARVAVASERWWALVRQRAEHKTR